MNHTLPITRRLEILNQRGLHARAAAKFVKLAALYKAQILVQRNDMQVSGQSIMGLMMLAAGPGCTIDLSVEGEQAPEALEAITDLIARKFDEE